MLRQQSSLTQRAQVQIAEVLTHGDYAIDATIGNGNDTLFLASCVGPKGQVIGLDLQELALERATQLLKEAGRLQCVQLIQQSHDRMLAYIPSSWLGKVKAVMFNLGYLPRSDQRLITQAETTIPALEASLRLLAPHGRITVIAYTGHDGGQKETDAIRTWLRSLPLSAYTVESIASSVNASQAPELFVITRKP